jgi:hypothetical protein
MPINPLNEKFDLLVKETLELWHSPSVSIAVIDGDQIWTKVPHLPFSRPQYR